MTAHGTKKRTRKPKGNVPAVAEVAEPVAVHPEGLLPLEALPGVAGVPLAWLKQLHARHLLHPVCVHLRTRMYDPGEVAVVASMNPVPDGFLEKCERYARGVDKAKVTRAGETAALLADLPFADPDDCSLMTGKGLRRLLKRKESTLRQWVGSGLLKPVGKLRVRGHLCLVYRLADAERVSAEVGRDPDKVAADERTANEPRPLPPEPTDIPPGPKRVAVYQWRWANGYSLYHPNDVNHTIDARELE